MQYSGAPCGDAILKLRALIGQEVDLLYNVYFPHLDRTVPMVNLVSTASTAVFAIIAQSSIEVAAPCAMEVIIESRCHKGSPTTNIFLETG